MATIRETGVAALRWLGRKGADMTAHTVLDVASQRLKTVALRAKLEELERELHDVEKRRPRLMPNDTRDLHKTRETQSPDYSSDGAGVLGFEHRGALQPDGGNGVANPINDSMKGLSL